MRDANTANKRKIDRSIYQQALDVQSACNLSGVARSLAHVCEKIWDEARSIGEGTHYVNTHPVVRLFLHQMAYLSGSHVNLLGDEWTEAAQLCNALTGNFWHVGPGGITVYEAQSGFYIVDNTTGQVRGMGDGVDRYADDTGHAYNVGTPEFYELLRADVRENWAELREAYFREEEAPVIAGDGYADGGEAYTDEELDIINGEGR